MEKKTVKKANYIFDEKLLAADMITKREKENLSLREAGKQAQMFYSRLQIIETAKHVPSIPVLLAVCEWLQVHPQKYFTIKK